MGLLSVGGVQGIVSLMSSLLLLLPFELQLGLTDKFVQFAQSFTDITSISKTLFFDVGPLKVKHLVEHALTAFENSLFFSTSGQVSAFHDGPHHAGVCKRIDGCGRVWSTRSSSLPLGGFFFGVKPQNISFSAPRLSYKERCAQMTRSPLSRCCLIPRPMS